MTSDLRIDASTLAVLPHLSVTSYDQFCKCPAQWAYVRIDGIKIPPGIAAHVGSGLHGAAETDMKQKIVTGVDLPAADLADAAVAAYKARVEKDGVLCTRDERPALGGLLADGCDRAAAFARTFATEAAPLYRPASVEQFVKYHDQMLPIPWVGYIDLTTADQQLVDWKTAAKRWPSGREHRENGATVYTKLYTANHGEPPSDVAFEVFHNQKGGIGRDRRPTVRTDDDWNVLQRGALTMIRMIVGGDFPPCSPNAWWCSPAHCGLWWVCRHIPERLRRLPNV